MAYNFINPYNFIPLGANDPQRSENSADTNGLTGCIEFSLLTKTPLIIPNTSNNKAFSKKNNEVSDHKSFDFFSYTDISDQKDASDRFYEPVIPGSEIRGMIRSNYEILTNSCLSSLDSDQMMSKRVGEPFNAGLIKKTQNGFDLYDATDCIFRADKSNSLADAEYVGDYKGKVKSYLQKDLSEGQKVTFSKIKRSKGKALAKNINNGNNVGYVLMGEEGPSIGKNEKHNCHIFEERGNSVKKNIDLSLLKNVLKLYKENSNRYSKYRGALNDFISDAQVGECFPTYYSKITAGEKEIIFLSPASITREVYDRTLADMVGSHRTCNDKNCLCPACRLFGTVISEKNQSVASKVKFADMKLVSDFDNNIFEDVITLDPLSSPKLNNMEFYLKKPSKDAIFWNYDYYMDSNGNIYRNDAGINGRKFYWHNLNMNKKNNDPSKINASFRPLKRGIEFKGKVFFEDINEVELNTLVYTIMAGDEEVNSKKHHGYKLGHAKPLGYGSIAMSVDKISIRTVSIDKDKMQISYDVDDYEYSVPQLDSDIIDGFRIMTNFTTVSENISYPRTENSEDIFAWFVKNHGGQKMRNKRIDENYIEYMKPLCPKLQQNVKKVNNNSSNLKKETKQNYEIGKIYDGKVIGHNASGYFAKVKLDKNMGSASFWDGGKFIEGETVRLKYKGINKDGRNHWDNVE